MADGQNTLTPEMQGAIDSSNDPSLRPFVDSMIQAESSYNPKARSTFDVKGQPTGHAYGLMQLTPDTAAKYGLKVDDGSIYDVKKNIAAGSAEVQRLQKKYNGDMTKALAEYNTGLDASNGIGGFHQGVKDYASKVINGYNTRMQKAPLVKPSPATPTPAAQAAQGVRPPAGGASGSWTPETKPKPTLRPGNKWFSIAGIDGKTYNGQGKDEDHAKQDVAQRHPEAFLRTQVAPRDETTREEIRGLALGGIDAIKGLYGLVANGPSDVIHGRMPWEKDSAWDKFYAQPATKEYIDADAAWALYQHTGKLNDLGRWAMHAISVPLAPVLSPAAQASEEISYGPKPVTAAARLTGQVAGAEALGYGARAATRYALTDQMKKPISPELLRTSAARDWLEAVQGKVSKKAVSDVERAADARVISDTKLITNERSAYAEIEKKRQALEDRVDTRVRAIGGQHNIVADLQDAYQRTRQRIITIGGPDLAKHLDRLNAWAQSYAQQFPLDRVTPEWIYERTKILGKTTKWDDLNYADHGNMAKRIFRQNLADRLDSFDSEISKLRGQENSLMKMRDAVRDKATRTFGNRAMGWFYTAWSGRVSASIAFGLHILGVGWYAAAGPLIARKLLMTTVPYLTRSAWVKTWLAELMERNAGRGPQPLPPTQPRWRPQPPRLGGGGGGSPSTSGGGPPGAPGAPGSGGPPFAPSTVVSTNPPGGPPSRGPSPQLPGAGGTTAGRGWWQARWDDFQRKRHDDDDPGAPPQAADDQRPPGGGGGGEIPLAQADPRELNEALTIWGHARDIVGHDAPPSQVAQTAIALRARWRLQAALGEEPDVPSGEATPQQGTQQSAANPLATSDLQPPAQTPPLGAPPAPGQTVSTPGAGQEAPPLSAKHQWYSQTVDRMEDLLDRRRDARGKSRDKIDSQLMSLRKDIETNATLSDEERQSLVDHLRGRSAATGVGPTRFTHRMEAFDTTTRRIRTALDEVLARQQNPKNAMERVALDRVAKNLQELYSTRLKGGKASELQDTEMARQRQAALRARGGAVGTATGAPMEEIADSSVRFDVDQMIKVEMGLEHLRGMGKVGQAVVDGFNKTMAEYKKITGAELDTPFKQDILADAIVQLHKHVPAEQIVGEMRETLRGPKEGL